MNVLRGSLATLALGVLLAACVGPREIEVEPVATGANAVASAADGEWITLFDGTTTDGWTMAGPGGFNVESDGSMLGYGGMGMLYYEERPFRDFILEFDYKTATDSANSGVFVRFPEKSDDPWYAVNHGYEIQIDDTRDALHRTGAIYTFSPAAELPVKPVGEWNTMRIEVRGQHYQVFLNDQKVNDFYGERGREGYIGVQNHDDLSKVWYRDIRVQPLADSGAPESLAEAFRVPEEELAERAPIRVLVVTATHGFRHEGAIEQIKETLPALGRTTEFDFTITEDVDDLNATNLANYDLLFFANSTLRLKREAQEAAAEDARVWDVQLMSPDGRVDGTLTITGEGDDLEGTLLFPSINPQAAPLRNVAMEGDQLSFDFDGGEYGTIEVKGTAGDRFAGTFNVMGMNLDLTGPRAEAEAVATEEEILVTPEQQQAVMDFLAAGKGIAVAHAGLDAFYEWPEYKAMVGGGLFESHPWTQPVEVIVEETSNPATEHLGERFAIRDEIYVLDENPRWNSKVLASLDMQSVGVEQGPADMSRNDYPISWVREHNGGKVFVTKLGHFADVWTNPAFVQHILQGMRMAADRIESDFSGHLVKETLMFGIWPDDLAIDEEGIVWVAELSGAVFRYDPATGDSSMVAEIATTDPQNIEHGLYGIEVDPAFYSGSPYIYLMYAEPETFINTLSRFRYEDGRLDLGSEEVLLRVPTEPACCHQAGDLEWGPDGTLYVSTGDTGQSKTHPKQELTEEEIGAFVEGQGLTGFHDSRLADSERTSQNLQELRGKILRINKDGTIPKDNPFFGEPGVRWEIYAYGLRNPYRFKVDDNGDVYIGVVGPDAHYDYDEYNIASEGGENFGWPRSMGTLFFNEWTPDAIPGYEPPFWEYTYQTGGRSASMGPIYRYDGPGAFPPAFQDSYFVYDWARGWIKWGRLEEMELTSDTESDVKGFETSFTTPRLTHIKLFDHITDGTRPISIELGPDGAIYVANFDGFWDRGGRGKLTRYRWVTDDDEPVSQSDGEAAPSVGGR